MEDKITLSEHAERVMIGDLAEWVDAWREDTPVFIMGQDGRLYEVEMLLDETSHDGGRPCVILGIGQAITDQ